MALMPIAVLPPKGRSKLWALADVQFSDHDTVVVGWPFAYEFDREKALKRAQNIAKVSAQDVFEVVGGRLEKR